MKKSIALTAAAICTMMLTASLAYAEQMGAPQQGEQQGGGKMMEKPMPQDPQMMANHKAEEELEFKNRKEEMLLRITNRMAMMQKTKDCIEAATTHEALRNCKPEGGPPPQGMMGGPGMMGGGMMQGRGGLGGGMMMGGQKPQGGMDAPPPPQGQ
jgi:hypothetical protein